MLSTPIGAPAAQSSVLFSGKLRWPGQRKTEAAQPVQTDNKSTALRKQFRASILGQAVGDALGCGVEFLSPAQIRQQYPNGLKDITGGGEFNWEPGDYTDDTQMLVALSESLIQHPQGNLWDMLDRWIGWKNSNPPDIGNLTRDALKAGEKLDRSTADPTDAGRIAWEATGKNSAGNGGIMRSAAIGLMYHDNPEKLRQISDQSCALTHYDPRCRASAIAQGLLLADILHGKVDKTPGKRQESLKPLFEKIASELEAQSPDVAEAIRAVPTLKSEDVRTSGYTIHTVQVAFWALYHFDNLEDALIDIVNRGDDADTTAAVAGSLLGALHGEEAIPARFLNTLKETDNLRTLADRLYNASVSGQFNQQA